MSFLYVLWMADAVLSFPLSSRVKGSPVMHFMRLKLSHHQTAIIPLCPSICHHGVIRVSSCHFSTYTQMPNLSRNVGADEEAGCPHPATLRCTMLCCMLCYCLNWWTSLMVDMVACWWPRPSLPHLPAASAALSWCCYGDRARDTLSTLPQHGSYKIVHLNLQLSKILKVLSYNVGCVHLHQNIILYF